MGLDITTRAAIERVFQDPAAAWTIDEVAGRFGLSLGEAIRAMSDLEMSGVVRRVDDEYVPARPMAS